MALPSLKDYYTANSKKLIIYSDFVDSFLPSPDNSQLALMTNENAVKQAIKNLCLTGTYERYKKPYVGGNIYHDLFSPITPQVQNSIKQKIESVIQNFEPRATSVDVIVSPSQDETAYNISITFATTLVSKPYNINLVLSRVR